MNFINRLWFLWFFLGMTCIHQSSKAQHIGVPDSMLSKLFWLADDWESADGRDSLAFIVQGDSIIQGVSFSKTFEKNNPLNDTFYITSKGLTPGVGFNPNGKPAAFYLYKSSDTSWAYKLEKREVTFRRIGFDTLQVNWKNEADIPVTFVRKPRIQRFEMPGDSSIVVMRKFWHLTYLSGSNRSQSKEEAARIQSGHMAHLGMLAGFGKACVAGPTDGIGEVRGFVIFTTATMEEAVFLANLDPAVQSGRLSFRIDPWWAMEGAVLK
jgi:hypothetical protein